MKGVIEMQKTIVSLIIVGLIAGTSIPSYASDWDKAGKALAVVEGVRVITGGNVDIIGNLTGISRNSIWRSNQGYGRDDRGYDRSYYDKPARSYRCSSKKSWVPHYVWKKKYVPEHKEYSEKYGKIIVEGHYIKYKVEDGGHWEYL